MMIETREQESGPLIIDVEGTELTSADIKRLQHPLIGGVILFARNYVNRRQLKLLTSEIKRIRKPELLITVDQEGGRVQRFRDEFTRIPSARDIAAVYHQDKSQGLELARASATVMAHELIEVGVDLSFAPVLDIDQYDSKVIGDRSFGSDPRVVSELGAAWFRGMTDVGMAGVGKHFPGHGSVREDSHFELPVDHRCFEDVDALDLVPFKHLIEHGLQGIMTAHVLHDQVDGQLCTFSTFWIKEILRKRLRFKGIVFSDDLAMEAVDSEIALTQKIQRADEAGCDLFIFCNRLAVLDEFLESDGIPDLAVADGLYAAIALRKDNLDYGKEIGNRYKSIENLRFN